MKSSGDIHVTVTTIGARAAFLGATSVLALIVTTPAQARCVSAGTTATCDAAAPNPEINGVIGTQVTVQSGAIVRLDDPFAGASVRYETATINNGGTLTTAAGSQILDANTTTAVASGGGVTINHSGTITARRANARGVALGQGDTLTVNAGGVIETLGAGSSLVFQNSSAAVAIGGSGSSVTINGIVRSAGDFAPAITTSTSGFFGPTLSPAAITIGATGAVGAVFLDVAAERAPARTARAARRVRRAAVGRARARAPGVSHWLGRQQRPERARSAVYVERLAQLSDRRRVVVGRGGRGRSPARAL